MKILTLLLLVISQPMIAATIHSFRSEGGEFSSFLEHVRSNLGEEHKIIDNILNKDDDYQKFRRKILSEKPSFLLLLDNKALNFTKSLVKEKHSAIKAMAGVATMSINLKHELKESTKVCGVSYEPPALRIVTQFQLKTKKKVNKLFVVYRESIFKEIVKEASIQLKREGIELISSPISDSFSSAQLEKTIKSGLDKADAFWVLTDNIVINRSNFESVWLKLARKSNKPFLCSVKGFAREDLDFCTFSTYPNPEELAIQTVSILRELIEEGGSPEEMGVEHVYRLDSEINKRALKRLYPN